MSRRALLVTPHFPPDTSAASHRVRLLAPHLADFDWHATVVAVDPRDYEGPIDPRLASLVPETLRVVRSRAWSASWTRRLGVGDLGLRALAGLYRTCATLLAEERFDVIFITTYPIYPAALGPRLKKAYGVPLVVDLQDPWVGAWGDVVGGGPGGSPDFKSRATRRAASWLERYVLPSADAITAVSDRTALDALARINRSIPTAAIPLGGEEADFVVAGRDAVSQGIFDPHDGCHHLCYVGTILPLARQTVAALLTALAHVRDQEPALYRLARLHFIGTSNRRAGVPDPIVMPLARELGVADSVRELPLRVDYFDALRVQTSSDGILLLGSTERHYTASKIFPALLARRPILAAFHEASSASEMLRAAGRSPSVRLVTYRDEVPVPELAAALYPQLAAFLRSPSYDRHDVDEEMLSAYSAAALAGRLAAVFESVQGMKRAA
jgi:hypothetical protein